MGCRRAEVIAPEAKDSLQIPRDTLEHNRRDGDKGAVLHARGKNGVLLRKVKSVAERCISGLGTGADDDVHLKKGVEDVDLLRGEVTLVEGRDLKDLVIVSMCQDLLENSQRTCCRVSASEQKSLLQYLA